MIGRGGKTNSILFKPHFHQSNTFVSNVHKVTISTQFNICFINHKQKGKNNRVHCVI